MNRTKKIGLGIILVFVAIQLIQPAHNKSEQVVSTDFFNVYRVPGNVKTLLQNACYDCHSNNTNYPWYSNIQPMAWLMSNHIRAGKEELNFSVFGNYPARRQINKLKGIANQIKDGEMPIASYKMMHRSANLTKEDKVLIGNWMNKTADSLSANN